MIGKSMRDKTDQVITAVKATLANEALERKAENARELGLDYESGYSTGFMDGAIKAQEANCEPIRCTPNCEALLQKLVAQRKPLTDEEINALEKSRWPEGSGLWGLRSFARIIEAVHGIKGEA
jgi:hypothetical protein